MCSSLCGEWAFILNKTHIYFSVGNGVLMVSVYMHDECNLRCFTGGMRTSLPRHLFCHGGGGTVPILARSYLPDSRAGCSHVLLPFNPF